MSIAIAPVIIFVFLIIGSFILNQYDWFKTRVKENREFLDLLSIISILGLAASLSLTIYQFNTVQERTDELRRSELHARADALQSEIEVNLKIGDSVEFSILSMSMQI